MCDFRCGRVATHYALPKFCTIRRCFGWNLLRVPLPPWTSASFVVDSIRAVCSESTPFFVDTIETLASRKDFASADWSGEMMAYAVLDRSTNMAFLPDVRCPAFFRWPFSSSTVIQSIFAVLCIWFVMSSLKITFKTSLATCVASVVSHFWTVRDRIGFLLTKVVVKCTSLYCKYRAQSPEYEWPTQYLYVYHPISLVLVVVDHYCWNIVVL